MIDLHAWWFKQYMTLWMFAIGFVLLDIVIMCLMEF